MFYCGKVLEGAHDAENDVLATIDVLKGQCNKYCKNILELLEECKDENQYLDLSRVIILKDGVPCYNIGKAKGVPVKKDIGLVNGF